MFIGVCEASQMGGITLRVLDGADKGQTFDNLRAPVTIGREEGNDVQLNDERVSRCHAKLQFEDDHVVLADCVSTNGTKVNGEAVTVRALRYGDLISVGRSVLQFGSREQIAKRLADLRRASPEAAEKLKSSAHAPEQLEDGELQAMLFTLEPPKLPDRLTPLQAARLSEILEYLHVRVRHLVATVEYRERHSDVVLDAHQWHELIDLQSRVAEYLRTIGNPD